MLVTAGKLIFQSRATTLRENCKPAKSPPCTDAELDSSQHVFHRKILRKKCWPEYFTQKYAWWKI